MKLHVIVGSASPRKIEVVRSVLAELLRKEVTAGGMEVPSGVPPTPHEAETRQGAINRAAACQGEPADFWVGLESGLVDRYGETYEEAWACIRGKSGEQSLGYSSGLKVPDAILLRMKQSGRPHYMVMEQLERERNLPHDTWSNYSGGLILREQSLREAVRNAYVGIGCQPVPQF